MKLCELYFVLTILSLTCQTFGQTFEQIDSTLTERVKAGNDTLQIKLITRPSLSYNKFLSIVAKSKGGWYGELYSFDKRNERKEVTKTFNLKTKYSLQPKKNWDSFIAELYKLNISNLTSKHCDQLDGVYYTLKIITEKSMTEWEYDCYIGIQTKLINNDDQAKIIRMITRGSKRKRVK